MPVRNGEPYIDAAIRSLREQTFTDLSLIISDNASTDATEEICRAHAREDERIEYHRLTENVGAAANHNEVFRLARGEFFKLASHDDRCHPEFLERCVELFDTAPDDVVLVYPRAVFIDAQGNTLRHDTDRLEKRSDAPVRRVAHVVGHINMVNALHGLIRTEALRMTRGIDSFVAADYVVLVELALLGQFWEVPEILFYRREHPGSSRGANNRLRDVLRWFDPQARGRQLVVPPRLRLVVEYMRSVVRMPLSPGQKVLCLGAVPTVHYTRRARVLAGRQRRRLRTAIAGRRRG